jgi:hypothetical protein
MGIEMKRIGLILFGPRADCFATTRHSLSGLTSAVDATLRSVDVMVSDYPLLKGGQRRPPAYLDLRDQRIELPEAETQLLDVPWLCCQTDSLTRRFGADFTSTSTWTIRSEVLL